VIRLCEITNLLLISNIFLVNFIAADNYVILMKILIGKIK